MRALEQLLEGLPLTLAGLSQQIHFPYLSQGLSYAAQRIGSMPLIADCFGTCQHLLHYFYCSHLSQRLRHGN